MANFETLAVSVDDTIGLIQLNRPAQLNPLSTACLRELVEAADWFDAGDEVRVVIVHGAGRAFSAGADLASFGDPAGTLPRDAADAGREMAEAIEAMQAVTIAAVHGHCVGGGVVLTAACDLRMAATGTRFSIPEVDLGIPLAWGGVPRLVREVGPAVAKELILSCRPFSAEEALQLRFINRVVADDELVEVWWERPAETLARLEDGELNAITPTISFLTSLSRYRHVADAFAGTEPGHRHAFDWGITTF